MSFGKGLALFYSFQGGECYYLLVIYTCIYVANIRVSLKVSIVQLEIDKVAWFIFGFADHDDQFLIPVISTQEFLFLL